jgi:PAS domain-containing protein
MPGALVPPATLPAEAARWLGESQQIVGSRPVLELHAPVISTDGLAGHLRLGYFLPPLWAGAQQLPFVGSLALPIFLLTPLFYLLVRREVRPLAAVNEQIAATLASNPHPPREHGASAELGDFLRNFSRFIEVSQNRIKELESTETELRTSAKLLGYRRARIESLIYALPEAIVVLDELGAAILANGKLRSLLGVDDDALLGHKPSQWELGPQVVAYLSRCSSRRPRRRRSRCR